MGQQQEMIVVQRLPLNEARIILDWIISMLFNDFKAQEAFQNSYNGIDVGFPCGYWKKPSIHDH